MAQRDTYFKQKEEHRLAIMTSDQLLVEQNDDARAVNFDLEVEPDKKLDGEPAVN